MSSHARDLVPSPGDVLGIGGLLAGAAFAWSILLGVVLTTVFVVVYGYSHRRRTKTKRREAARIADVASTIARLSSARDMVHSLARGAGLPSPWRITVSERSDAEWRKVIQASNYPPYECGDWDVAPVDVGFLGYASRLASTHELLDVESGAAFDSMLESRGFEAELVDALRFRCASYAAAVFRFPTPDQGYVDVGLLLESGDGRGVSVGVLERHFPSAVVEILFRVAHNEGLMNAAIEDLAR